VRAFVLVLQVTVRVWEKEKIVTIDEVVETVDPTVLMAPLKYVAKEDPGLAARKGKVSL